MTFDPALTIASVLVAIGGAGAGVGLATAARMSVTLCAGALVGVAIAAMHYMGMFAYRVEGLVQWSPSLVALSLATAVGGGVATAHLARHWSKGPRRHAATGALVAAIVSLHFLGMAAFEVTPMPNASGSTDTRTLVAMALGVALVALVAVGAGVSGHLIETRLRTSSETQLRHIALHDALTGLANRRRFAEALDAHCAALRDGGPGFALLLADLDRFKSVNDTLGHGMGDMLLRRVAERLRVAVAGKGEVARIGGDEFAILVAGEHTDCVEAIAARIVDLLANPFLIDGNVAEIGASVGLARAPTDGTTSAELTHNADLALYAAKTAGRNGFRTFDTTMAYEVEQRRSLEVDLRRAVAHEAFEVVYHPQGVVAQLRLRPSLPLSPLLQATRTISVWPKAEKRFIRATRTWISAVWRSGSLAMRRSPKLLRHPIFASARLRA